MSAAAELRTAASKLRELAQRATPGPWRLGRWAALVADRKHPDRMVGGGWDDAYGGCLVAESLMRPDREYFAAMHPLVAARRADRAERGMTAPDLMLAVLDRLGTAPAWIARAHALGVRISAWYGDNIAVHVSLHKVGAA